MLYTMCASIFKFWLSYGVVVSNLSPEVTVISFILIHVIL